MSKDSSSGPLVALVAADAAGGTALQPARDTFDAFAVAWKDAIVPPEEAAGFDTTGLRAVIVASPDAALPGVLAAACGLPVVRVPVVGQGRGGADLLYDAASSNLPGAEEPFATVAIGEVGAKNAALFVVAMLGRTDARLWAEWLAFRQRQTDAVLHHAPLADD